MIRFERGGDIILPGDFNARISNDKDFIQSDKFDVTNQIETLKITVRNAQVDIRDGGGRAIGTFANF